MTVALPVDGTLLALAAVSALALAGLGLSAQTRDRSRTFVVVYGVFVLFGVFALAGVWLFLNHDKGYVEDLLADYWLAALLAIFVLEGAMLLYFAPSESLVPVAIGMALTTDIAPAGIGTYALIIATAVVGATVGQYLLFVLAKRWGREWLLARPWFRVSESRLDDLEARLERMGLLAVPLSNTLLFTRGMLTVPAGLIEMEDHKFVLVSALGTLSFETILAALTLGVVELGFL
jgi:membrane protein DedA with SNARE-associated domain